VETHPWSYFNYLVLSWSSGIYTDEFVLRELDQCHESTSYLFGLLYEAQSNWLAAKTNYQLALETSPDGSFFEIKKRLEHCTEMQERHNESFLVGHLDSADIQVVRLSFNGKLAASF